jgi:hypothetical protein
VQVEYGEHTFDTDSLTTVELVRVQEFTAVLSGSPTPWCALNPLARIEDAAALLTVLLARHVGVEDAAELVASFTLADWRACFASGLGVPDGDS